MITENNFDTLLKRVVNDSKIITTKELHRMEFNSYDIKKLVDNGFITRNVKGVYTFNSQELLLYAVCLFNNQLFDEAFDTVIKYLQDYRNDSFALQLLIDIVNRLEFSYEKKCMELEDYFLNNTDKKTIGKLLVMIASVRYDFDKVVKYAKLYNNKYNSLKMYLYIYMTNGNNENIEELRDILNSSKIYNNFNFEKVARYIISNKYESAVKTLRNKCREKDINYYTLLFILTKLERDYSKLKLTINGYAQLGDLDKINAILEQNANKLSDMMVLCKKMVLDMIDLRDNDVLLVPKKVHNVFDDYEEIILDDDYSTFIDKNMLVYGNPRTIRLLADEMKKLILEKEISYWVENDLSNYESEGFIRKRK